MTDSITQYIRAGDLTFHVTMSGDPDHPPLVLLHGLASTSHMFDLMTPGLAQDHYVITFDQRGHGLSDKPDQGYDFETIAHDFDHVLVALNVHQPFILAGHSWGAYTTLYYAATRPARVKQVILIDGGIRPIGDSYPTWAEAERRLSPPEYINRSEADIRRMIREDWLGAAFRPELEAPALSVFDLSNPLDVHAHLSRVNHLQIARALWEFRPADYYAQVVCPVLIVLAAQAGSDPALDRYAQTAQTGLDNCHLVWLDKTIHDIPWQRPTELVDIMNHFLSRLKA